jgi:hypothetical protein
MRLAARACVRRTADACGGTARAAAAATCETGHVPGPRRTLSRRTLLRAGVIVGLPVLAGCDPVRAHRGATLSTEPTTPGPSAGATVSPLVTAIRAERALLAQYEAVIAAHPALRRHLAPIGGEHRAHLDALDALVAPDPRDDLGATPPERVAPGELTVAALVRAENQSVRALITACLTQPPDVAVLMASIAASESSHVVVLSEIGGR